MRFPFPGLGIVFDIDALGGGSYGARAWRVVMKHLDPERLAATVLVEGDTRRTLDGDAREFCIAIYGLMFDRSSVREAIGRIGEPGLAPPARRFVEGEALDREPLVVKGQIDAQGRLVTDEWTRSEHDLCREAGWGYAPKSVPPDLDRKLATELAAMAKGGAAAAPKSRKLDPGKLWKALQMPGEPVARSAAELARALEDKRLREYPSRDTTEHWERMQDLFPALRDLPLTVALRARLAASTTAPTGSEATPCCAGCKRPADPAAVSSLLVSLRVPGKGGRISRVVPLCADCGRRRARWQRARVLWWACLPSGVLLGLASLFCFVLLLGPHRVPLLGPLAGGLCVLACATPLLLGLLDAGREDPADPLKAQDLPALLGAGCKLHERLRQRPGAPPLRALQRDAEPSIRGNLVGLARAVGGGVLGGLLAALTFLALGALVQTLAVVISAPRSAPIAKLGAALFVLGGVLLGTLAAGLLLIAGAGWGPKAQRDRKRAPRAGPRGAALAFGLGLVAAVAVGLGGLLGTGVGRSVAIGFSPGEGQWVARVLFVAAPGIAWLAALSVRRLLREGPLPAPPPLGALEPPTLTLWVKDPEAEMVFLTALLVRVVSEHASEVPGEFRDRFREHRYRDLRVTKQPNLARGGVDVTFVLEGE